MFQHFTPGEAVKDSCLAAFGFSPTAFLAHVETGLVLGVLNIVVVIVFRVIELRMKYKAREQAPEEEALSRDSDHSERRGRSRKGPIAR